MKPRPQAAPPKRGGNLFTGIVIGLVIGTLMAGGFAWYVSRMPLPFQDKGGDGDIKPPPAKAPASATAQQPITLPGKPGDKVDDKPRFEFYKILPGEETKPGEAAKPAETAQPAQATQAAKPAEAAKPVGEPVFLQVGAFQNPAEADNLKARLALLGMEAGVQPATLPDKGTVYRVRLGPYAKPEEAASARSQLVQAGIQATVVKGN
ncbi:MAG: SPOR domain-containing protein [Rhodocyclaceae bacterium]|nr:SPOR domain-containing protein [Rhodocyclaceae bacterium]